MLLDPGFISPNTFILIRVAVASLLFFLFFRSDVRKIIENFKEFLICAVTGVVTNQLLFFNGLKHTSPIHASLIMVGTPLIVLWMSMYQKNHLNWNQWIGSAAGFLGTTWLIYSGSSSTNSNASYTGDLMVLLNAVSYAFYLNRVPLLIERCGPFQTMQGIFFIGLILCIPFGLSGVDNIIWAAFGWQEYLALAFVLFFTTFIAYALNAYAMIHSPASLVSNYIYLQPLFAVIIAILIGKDQLNWIHFTCGILIFTGIYISELKKD
ncbi:MAG: DMT family transporter [Bacteroidota bacterium]|nr:DMT family transporter [Bacteroidota bacterium]